MIAPPCRTLSFRSIALGLAGGLLVCIAAPYNDMAMQNTPLVGNNLPTAVMMMLFGFVVLINGPLWRWKPASAFSAFELAVAFTLMLVMCTVPSSGLMRYLPSNLTMPWVLAVENANYRDVVSRLKIAYWVFPAFEGDEPANWVGDPLALSFLTRWIEPNASPYGRWVVPFVSWGIFFGALAWALICIVCIIMRQWRNNEHLAFPLANIQLALLETPASGRMFNRLLSARSFWVAFSAVLLLHMWNGASTYFPGHLPPISRGFDLTDILNDKPWSFTDPTLRKATIYFSMIGVAFFVSGPVAFSLWFVLIIVQIYKMILGSATGDSNVVGINEQRHGAAIAIFLSLIWLGRKHLLLVAKQAFRGVRAGEAQGDYLGYRTSAWGLLGACGVMTAWLMAAGMGLLGAANVVIVLLIAFILVTRIIAEAGLIHGAMPVNPGKSIELAAIYVDVKAPLNTTYLTSTLHATLYDYREVLPVYTSHGMRVLDETSPADHDAERRRLGRRVIVWICVALVIAYVSSFWSSLWVNYHYAVTLDQAQSAPIDKWGIEQNPRFQVLDPTVMHERETHTGGYSRAGHLAFGFGVTTLLSILRLTFAWWPLHPVGYLIYATFPSVTFWFSVFLGWLMKRLVLRFGNATFYESCKPFFIGLIIGETTAAGFWLVMSIVLHACDVPYRSYLVLPQ